jgi:hypothetical protein
VCSSSGSLFISIERIALYKCYFILHKRVKLYQQTIVRTQLSHFEVLAVVLLLLRTAEDFTKPWRWDYLQWYDVYTKFHKSHFIGTKIFRTRTWWYHKPNYFHTIVSCLNIICFNNFERGMTVSGINKKHVAKETGHELVKRQWHCIAEIMLYFVWVWSQSQERSFSQR